MQRLSKDPDANWEGPGGKVHIVTDRIASGIGNYYTDCAMHLEKFPGRWIKRAATCFSCCAKDLLAGKDAPTLQREVGTALPFFLFRTTGGVMHGVPVWPNGATFCGLSTEAKLLKQTGRWEHEPGALSCIGCLATWR
jgi:hypothetical protein